MARYEALRDRLPLLYRPDADDAVQPVLPLGRDDLVEVGGDTDPIRFKATPRGEGSLIVELSAPGGPVRRLSLAPGRAPGSGFALEVRAIEGGGSLSLKPLAVLAVSDSVAPVGVALPSSFALQLKQRSLLGVQLLAVAGVLERLNREAGDVMQSHWFQFADRAQNSPFFLRGLALQKLGMPAPHDPPVRHFPYIDDLGRLASLLSLPPWQEPIVQDGGGAANPETVETYRQRIARIVALYEHGLGTVEAMRRMTEAQLPIDIDALPEQQDRPFSIEEYAALTTTTVAVSLPGQPTDYVGPLMHWPLANDGLLPSSPTVFVQSPTEDELAQVDADGDPVFAATVAPLLELYRGGALCVGVAYTGTVPPGRTLRIQPAHSSWLVGDAGMQVSSAGPGEDPTAPGPWKASKDAPGRSGHGTAADGREHALGRARQRRAVALRRRVDDGADRPAGDPLPRRARPRPAARDRDRVRPHAALPRRRLRGDGRARRRARDQRASPGGRRHVVGRHLEGPRVAQEGRLAQGHEAHRGGEGARAGLDRRDLRRRRLRPRRLPPGHERVVALLRRGVQRRGLGVAPARSGEARRQPRLPAAGDRDPARPRRRALDRHRAGPRALRRPWRGRPGRVPHPARGVPRPLPGPGLGTRRGRARAALGRDRPRRVALRRPRLLPVPDLVEELGAVRPRRLDLPAGRPTRPRAAPGASAVPAASGSGSTPRSPRPPGRRSPSRPARRRPRRP